MKLQVGKRVHYDSGPNMTPLVDVVMVLLIFLMLAGKFTGQENYIRSNTPLRQSGAGGATPPPGGFPKDEPLEVEVTAPVPGRFSARVGQYKAESVGELRGILERMKTDLAAAGTEVDNVQVVIVPTRDVHYQSAIEIYATAQVAGFKKVGFSTTR